MTSFSPIKSFIFAFNPLSEKVWQEFSQILSPIILEKGEYFTQTGQQETRVGILIEGLTRTFFVNEEGKEFNKYFSRPFTFVASYSSYITQTPSRLNIQALARSTVFVTQMDALNELAEKHHSIEKMLRKLAEFLVVKKEKREYELVMLDAEARYRIFKEDFPNLENEIPQYHIASYLGITPTQLSRIRGKK